MHQNVLNYGNMLLITEQKVYLSSYSICTGRGLATTIDTEILSPKPVIQPTSVTLSGNTIKSPTLVFIKRLLMDTRLETSPLQINR